jgi:small subunit ribosomal protein S15
MITKTRTEELVKQFGKSATDSGNADVQVAILTERISNLTPHFKDHKHDNHGMTGLMKMIGRRRRLLRYIKGEDDARYTKLIGALGLRK